MNHESFCNQSRFLECYAINSVQFYVFDGRDTINLTRFIGTVFRQSRCSVDNEIILKLVKKSFEDVFLTTRKNSEGVHTKM